MSQHRESRKRIAVAKIYNKTLTIKSLAEHEHMQKHRAELGSLYKLWIYKRRNVNMCSTDTHSRFSYAQTHRRFNYACMWEHFAIFFFFFCNVQNWVRMGACTWLCVFIASILCLHVYDKVAVLWSKILYSQIFSWFGCSAVKAHRYRLYGWTLQMFRRCIGMRTNHVLGHEIPTFTIKNLLYLLWNGKLYKRTDCDTLLYSRLCSIFAIAEKAYNDTYSIGFKGLVT